MKEWTLFLDRDGVINDRIIGGYVQKWSEFVFLDGVLECLPILARKFNRIVIVTNQQGIAKGLMSVNDLNKVHAEMLDVINQHGGRIDQVYFCAEHERENPPCRKPNTGMAIQAKLDFPDIDFDRAIMVGDSITDIEFGIRMNMKTILIETKPDIDKVKLAAIQDKIDYSFPSLYLFAQHLNNIL
ncbi:D-glycero-alpha-D-manno-heptose-1,7-bisphosphate 7-phosphatase [Aureispira anguillae]|uniref:D,D-heptose 1,7-bisphosphate phosphatase n=1 Tax=Aureispira anguillae TaxID=2864201 RepID=A0A915YG06_9BACT|nr:HAD-IIIA family hydrolase [Aureispira anguillae]BDS12288.1 HAD-IIIA family hydrolase [Aureispira anguillae]